MSTAALTTLGCKVNQCETAYLEHCLQKAGYVIRPFSEKADLYCINTCAVTAKAAMQSRQLIRRAARQNPAARLVVTGCYAQLAAADISRLDKVSLVLGNREKFQLPVHLSQLACSKGAFIHVTDMVQCTSHLPLLLASAARKTRAFLKVQDGCDAFCTYCIIPHVRGRSRSVDPLSIRKQVKNLLGNGHKEIVLTGIHLGQWGKDLRPRRDLLWLLQSITAKPLPARLRLSSLEVGEVTPELLDFIAATAAVCPHLHVPLQSGDATILRRMNRHYSPSLFKERLTAALEKIPGLALGTDVLVGFPGESERNFENTYRLLESLDVAYLHVFPFSARPTTPAARMANQVSPRVVRERCRLLRDLDRRKRQAFRQRFIGSVRPVLVESRQDRNSGGLLGFSDNYLPVVINQELVSPNEMVLARLDRMEHGRIVAAPV
ncbi:MAG: tRNA (N(6)-L-threonylcarbamoyladenosine(37)-C(2))-methylthiotransferase MtaB [Deltaproteobacteria bacterium]|nr:tRNA (N(6)-L-threonylcarbamoyladenosine(37)-C(2))-methylthiotransferase MtaB [Deltaproteobacteria bacterium]MBW2072928.1 tRNA (N(6)-L-threonylcarbamoyladenosine(37)-C(2))-methylthiotransferase MtaB [Deltaproteobacteria bacterium]